MPDNDPLECIKNELTKEIRVFCQKTEPICKEAKPLREEEEELSKNKNPSALAKKYAVDLRKALQDLEKSYLVQANGASQRINNILKGNPPKDPKEIPEWQKEMAPWYRKKLEEEAGFDVGKKGQDVKLSGDVSIKDKQATIILKGKF